MVELSKTGLVAEVDLTDRESGRKIGVGQIERSSTGHITIHVDGFKVPGCVEDGFKIGEIKVVEVE